VRAALAGPLPDPLQVGSGTALLVRGTLDPGGEAVHRLALRLGANPPVAVEGLRLAGGSRSAPLEWWTLLDVPAATPPGASDLTLIVEARSGRVEVGLGATRIERRTELERPEVPPAARQADRPTIAICMATYEPDPERFERQLDSIRNQSWRSWVCVISDDASSEDSLRLIDELTASDDRFLLFPSSERRGFYDNFERALQMAPADAELVALADQDDRWREDKLERLAAKLATSPEAVLAYSDMRVVDGEGRVISDTFWYASDNASEDIGTLAIVNTIFGVASLFRRELLDLVLPLPPDFSDQHYHDHWIALCARAAGEIVYLDEPTYDYIRHAESVTMRSNRAWAPPPEGALAALRLRVTRVGRRLRIGLSSDVWRTVYFDRYLLIRQFVAVLRLRLGDRMTPAQRRSLELLDSAERSPRAAGWLLARTLRPLLGRRETMGRERVLIGGLLWHRLAVARRGLRGASARRRN